jgi:hypothetical protein
MADNPPVMGTSRLIAACWFTCVLAAAGSLDGGDAMRMQVSPSVARAPALLTVSVTVMSASENRLLQVVAESPTFYRSSEIQVNGERATPLNVFEFRNLPTGLYQITGVLVGAHGQRAMVSKLVKIEPAVGASR